MRIAYLCDISPEHTQPYSGGNARIYQALKDHVGEVDILPQSWGLAEPVRRAIHSLPDSANLRLRWRAHLVLSPIIARSVTQALNKKNYDVLFGAYSFQSLAALKTPYPIVKAYTADATFTAYRRSQIGKSFGASWATRRFLDPLTLRAERKIYRNMDIMLWPSEWIKKTADSLYGLSEKQSLVVPWGANIEDIDAESAPLPLSVNAPVELLVVGRDWFAKGGPQAFETMLGLRQAGIDARLTVIGTTPPEFHMNEHVTVHPSLNKSVPAEKACFETIFRQAHFLVQPSFESWGFAFCEAAAFGLPSLCLNVGGVPVRDGVTGHALPEGSTSKDYVKIIRRYLANPKQYEALRLTARRTYETQLNWDAWGKSVERIVTDRISNQSR